MNRTLVSSKYVLFFAGMVVLLAGGPAGATEDVLTPHDVARLRSVSGVAVSPDGNYIAYTLSVPRMPMEEENGPAWTELHVIDTRNGQRMPFVTGAVDVGSIAWLPDSRSISFLSKRGQDKFTALYTIPISGGEARRAAGLETSILGYSWSPDGSQVALLALEPEGKDSSDLKKKGFDQEIYEEDWRHHRVYVAETRIGGSTPRALDLDGSVFDVEWSPVDDRLAVSLAPNPSVDNSYMGKRILVVDSTSGEQLGIVDNSGKLGQIAWSPDGKRIAIVSGADIHDPAAGRLLVGSVTGGAPADLLNNHLGHVSRIAWRSPDSILYVNDVGVWTTLESISPDGSSRGVVVPSGGPVLESLSLSRDGRTAAFIASSPIHPGEVYAMTHQETVPRRVTNSNPWLDTMRFGSQEVIQFKARDGLALEGILIRPLGAVEDQRYPLVLTVHGGPESHHRNGWLTGYSNPGQMAAARGMAVFYTNYRGSTGRGVEFSKLSQADFAGKEFDDLVDAVDHLIAIGVVDKDRVGITGGSYGGYATAWGATYYSDRFAAGVMAVGISNKISKVGTTDIPEEEFLVHARSRPWDNWQKYLERSPIYYAGRSKTPLLILHGKDDPRVNVGQSRELYRHLKIRGQAPVRLVLYPGEGHGNRRAAARLDYSLRALRWLEHYLLGPGGDPPDFSLSYERPAPPTSQ